MGLGKDGYYSAADILKYKAQYNIVLGERSPGKSYDIKSRALINAYNSGKCTFALIRRYQEDIKADFIEHYFADNERHDGKRGDVLKITRGEFDCITVYRNTIYFGITQDGKKKPIQACGRVFALALDERYKSTQYPEITDIIYEEFVTSKLYLRNEPDRLLNLVSTICRSNTVKVWMIANTISRICPYFQEWCLDKIPRMQAGTIDTYKLDDTIIAVEFAPSRSAKNKMFFGAASKSIQGGQWDTKPMPHLPRPYTDYDKIYEMYVRESGFTFKLEYLLDPDCNAVLYVYPYTKTCKDDIPILSAEFTVSPMIRPYLKRNIKAECRIAALYQERKICYASNLCGADFVACLNNMQGGLICR